MKVHQDRWDDTQGWHASPALTAAQLVLVFGDRASIGNPRLGSDLAARWPDAAIIGCSTAGQISGTDVFDAGVVATAIQFDYTEVRLATAPVTAIDSAAAGAALGKSVV